MLQLPFPPPDPNFPADFVDTLSESSDNATILSLSLSDLTQLGAGSIREDVRVSRKKLENLILKEKETNPERNFIESLMDKTNTHIQWPSRMKIGAKTKKDLYVRIYGHNLEDVNEAKAAVLAELGPHRDLRITLKMEISYTDHSHLIGCRGATIRRVMEDTGCHIHFPDSNRMSREVKSNQVTIAGGAIAAVEQARSRVREQSPLIYQFILPLQSAAYDIVKDYGTFIENIQTSFNVQVTTHPPNKLQQTMVSVKGCESNGPMIKEAIGKILSFVSNGVSLNSLTVESTMEISSQQHGFVREVHDTNIHGIMNNTGAKIIFPDLSDGNIQQIKRSRVYIHGDISAVYNARQQLIGCLPLRMIFDLSDEHHLDWDYVRSIGSELNVHVKLINRNRSGSTGGMGGSSLPPPVPGRSRTIQIIAPERNTGNIYEARRRILGGIEPPHTANIPGTYALRQVYSSGLNFHSMASMNSGLGRFNSVPTLNLPPLVPSPSPSLVSPILSPSFWPPTPFNSPFLSPTVSSLVLPGMTTPTQVPNNSFLPGPQHQGHNNGGYRGSMTPVQTPDDFPGSLGPPPGLDQFLNSPGHSSQSRGFGFGGFGRRERSGDVFFRDFDRTPGSGPHQGWERSASQPTFQLSSLTIGPRNRANGSSPSMANPFRTGPLSGPPQPHPIANGIKSGLSGGNGDNSPSISVSSLSAASSTSSLQAAVENGGTVGGSSSNGNGVNEDANKDDKRHLALKAMYQAKIGNSLRVPNAEWAGMGFSKTHTSLFPTSSGSLEAGNEGGGGGGGGGATTANGGDDKDEKEAGTSASVTLVEGSTANNTRTFVKSPLTAQNSNLLEFSGPNRPNAVAPDLTTLFVQNGLEKYIDNFRAEEIDLSSFGSLTEVDLRSLGVSSYPARKRMLLLINQLTCNRSTSLWNQ